MAKQELSHVRLDKWLWAARFFKTRSLAHDAVEGGKVFVEGLRAKPSRMVSVGVEIEVNSPRGKQVVIVEGVSEQRGSASIAEKLYQETADSKLEREKIAEMRAYAGAIAPEERPNTQDRRMLRRIKEGE